MTSKKILFILIAIYTIIFGLSFTSVYSQRMVWADPIHHPVSDTDNELDGIIFDPHNEYMLVYKQGSNNVTLIDE